MTPAIPAWLLLLAASPFIGSFLGVVAMRYGDRRSIFIARSQCDQCRKTLRWNELIPLVSWLLLRRRCRHCGAHLNAFYPMVELAAIVPVAWAIATVPDQLLIASAIFGWTLLVLALIDWKTLSLPNMLTYFLLITGIAAAYFFDRDGLPDHLIGAVGGFVAFSLVGLLYKRLRGRDGLGQGDAKLLAGLGAWVSWQGLPTLVFLGTVTALIFGLMRCAWGRRLALDDRLPFGPFLALGGWIVWLYGPLALR